MMRERFSDEEWRQIRHIPFDAFYFGALADGTVEDGEVKAFVESLERPGAIKDQLHREIMLDHAAGGTARVAEEMKFESSETPTAMHARFGSTKTVLKEKLTRQEYQAFFKSVWISAMAVAAASTEETGHLWKKEKKAITKKEAAALATFAAAWDIDMSFIKQHTV